MRVALDRGVTDRAIALARTFGARGRVLIPPEDLGPKSDLNDWLRVGAKGDPATFRFILQRALATSATPWALQIQRLPPDLTPGIWRTMPACGSFCASLAIRDRSAAMRTCAS